MRGPCYSMPPAQSFPSRRHIDTLPRPMKAQRRHELQANELARQLETFPETLKRHAGTIMLVISVALVIFFLVRYRRQAAESRAVTLGNSLATARQGPMVIRTLALRRVPPEQIAAM